MKTRIYAAPAVKGLRVRRTLNQRPLFAGTRPIYEQKCYLYCRRPIYIMYMCDLIEKYPTRTDLVVCCRAKENSSNCLLESEQLLLFPAHLYMYVYKCRPMHVYECVI